MFVPDSWRETNEEGGLILLAFLWHLALTLCVVADFWAWKLLPQDEGVATEVAAKGASLLLFVPLLVAYALFVSKLWRRFNA